MGSCGGGGGAGAALPAAGVVAALAAVELPAGGDLVRSETQSSCNRAGSRDGLPC